MYYQRPAIWLAACLALAACGDQSMNDYPSLVPAEAVLAEPSLPTHASADPESVAADLRAAQRGLRAAAAATPAPVLTPDLAARARALQARAAAMRCEGGSTAGCPP